MADWAVVKAPEVGTEAGVVAGSPVAAAMAQARMVTEEEVAMAPGFLVTAAAEGLALGLAVASS